MAERRARALTNLTPHERRNHWNMQHWGFTTECGTVACAAGHCALDPWFRRRGLGAKFSAYTKDFGWPVDDDEWTDKLFDFFGFDGTKNIFMNQTKRPVSKVIREVRAHIKALQSSHDYATKAESDAAKKKCVDNTDGGCLDR